MSEKKRAGLSRLQNMSSYDDLVAMAAGDDKGNIAHFEQGFKDKAVELPLSQLHSFPNHPFKVNDDDAMQSLSDSIRNRGVLHPIVVRKDPDGGYQIISGHRRKRACELAEIGTIPAYIVELSDDEAIILMADANFYQREGLLPSEKARAYRMKSDAIKRHQGVKGKNTIDEIGEGTSDSAATVKRFIRLSYLTDNLLDMVDEKKIGQEPAIHISYLNEELQEWIYDVLEQSQVNMTSDQAKDLRKIGEEGYLDKPKIWEILMRTIKKKRKYTLKQEILDKYFAEDTAQKTITFEKMYKDGICKVSANHYSKMVEFYDINYDLLEIEDQGTILEDYSKLINYFDPSIQFQLFLFNRRVSEEELAAQLDIPLQGDAFDDIREEYSQMLKKQSAKGTNGIIKSKYFVFGIDAADLKEARAKLNNIEKDVIRNLNAMGTNAHSLDGKERLRVLHEYFNQGSLEPFHFSFKELSESGKSVKDYIAPPGFDFRYPNRFRSGKMFGCVHYLDIIAPRFSDELLKRLLDIDDNLTITMHMQTMDPVKAIKMLKGALTNIQKMKIEEQKKAVRSGYDMDILPTDIITYEKDTLELLDDLNSSNQKIIKMTFLITTYGETKKKMEALQQRVSGIIQQANCNLRPLQYLQEQGLMASAPIGCNETGIERVLTTKSTAILVPFCTQELFMPSPAIYYGLNALSNNMIMADRKKLRTPNGVILGTPGSGKSFSAKREILSSFLQTRDDVVICDPEGEYFPLVQALHGQVVRLATNSKDFLNPMDIQISHKDDKEALKLKSDFLITLCDLIAGGKEGLENDEKGIIDECIRHIYDKYFDNPVPENMPLLEDLYDALLAHKNPKAERIANSLVLYVHGSQNYFNHRTNVDSQNRIMCFDIRDLGNQLKELGMLIVQDAVWNRVSMNRERKIATRYYCDEFHLLLKEKQTAIYSVEIWKRFRKWGGIPTGLTQNVGDFLRSEEIEGILGNSDFVYLLNQNAKDQHILADKLGISEKQLAHVTNSEPGSGLILFDNVVIPFVDKYPTDTKTFRIMNTRPEESVKREEGA